MSASGEDGASNGVKNSDSDTCNRWDRVDADITHNREETQALLASRGRKEVDKTALETEKRRRKLYKIQSSDFLARTLTRNAKSEALR